MKKFVFREAQLLALKDQQVTVAELALSEASERVAAARSAVEEELAAIEDLSLRILNDQPSGFVHASQTAFALRTRLEMSRARLAKREQELIAAQGSLRGARMAADALHTLRSSRLEKYRAACDRLAQSDLDFNAARKWMMREE
jgi:hypothetical protein